MSAGDRIVFRTLDKGLCVGKVVWAKDGKVRVRLWYGVGRAYPSWSPKARTIDAVDILGEATSREVTIGLAVDHNRTLIGG